MIADRHLKGLERGWLQAVRAAVHILASRVQDEELDEESRALINYKKARRLARRSRRPHAQAAWRRHPCANHLADRLGCRHLGKP